MPYHEEVTNAQYSACVNAAACSEPANANWPSPELADHPVTNVTWEQANQYAQWVGGRLPSEAEWEIACRSTDERIYPWGDEAPDETRANSGDVQAGTTAVGSYPDGASPFGLLDMAGNVWEWTSSQPLDYPYDANDGREEPDSTARRVIRGGSFSDNADDVRCVIRDTGFPAEGDDTVGFRVLKP